MTHLKEYDCLATIYDRKWSRYLQNTLDKTIAYCPLSGEEEILDVACGTGELERRLLAKYDKIRIIGCDISQSMLKVARDKLTGYNNVSFIECPADEISLEDESKDVIICCNSFHFFKKPKNVLQEWRRILRRSGKVFILDWCQDFWLCKALEFLKGKFDKAHHHIYTVDELSSMLLACNFRSEKNWRFKIDWLWGMMALYGQKFFEPR